MVSVFPPPCNHDAVWIFIKRRDCASNVWYHVDLDTAEANHSASAPLTAYFDNKRLAGDMAKGIYLKRSADGVGNISPTNVTLKMMNIPTGDFDFSVMGIEMVNIPTGDYYLGDGSIFSGAANARGSFQKNTNIPYLVQSENSITTPGLTSTSTSEPVVNLPAHYPKGHAEFHCMKYELTQQQYVDFLNMLQNDQFNTRKIPNFTSGVWPTVTANHPERSADFLAWMDLCAYLDGLLYGR